MQFLFTASLKNERANIAQDELGALRELAAEMLAYDDDALTKAVGAGRLTEVFIQ